MSESRFDFLKDLVKNIPDISNVEEFEEGEEVAFSSSSSNSSGRKLMISNEIHHSNVKIESLDNVQQLLEPNGNRLALQRSQSLQQPPTVTTPSSSHHQIQFCLNNYTSSNYHKPNSTQFLAESMIKFQQQQQLLKATTNIEPRAKISRINSLPAPATITSASLNTPTPTDLRAPNSFPIQITYPSSLTTTKQQSEQHHAPIVNIDYSKFSLPMTTATAATTSPTIKIDFSNLSNHTAMMQMPAPTATSSVIPGIDEDYDDI